MAMTNAGRATAIYNAISSDNPNFSKLSGAEQAALLASLTNIWGAGDLVYIKANAVVPSAVVSVTGVTPGGGTSGPGTATGTIT